MANPLVTTVGDQQIAQRVNSLGTKPTYVASGTGTVAPLVTDTALGVEVTDSARPNGTPTVSSATYQVVGTISYTAAHAITEAGLFDAVTVGNMYVRGTFAAINVVSGDSIQFTIQVTFA